MKKNGASYPAIRYKSSPPLADAGFSLLSGMQTAKNKNPNINQDWYSEIKENTFF